MRNGQLLIPEQVADGTVSVTQFSAAITFDATALAALNASELATSVPIIGRAFRAGSTHGTPYLISAYDDVTGVAALDRVYSDATDAAETYGVFKAYHTPPFGADFVRFRMPTDVTEGYPLRTDWTKAELDGADPQRDTQGNPYRIVYWGIDPVTRALPLFELWPHPTTAKVIEVPVVTKGLTDWSPSLRTFPHPQFVFPPQLNDEVLKHKMNSLAYRWAEAHKGKYEELRGITWRLLWQQTDKDYAEAIRAARRIDRELSPKFSNMPRLSGFNQPVDARFWQSHDVVLP
jgi:hypothetical protein